MNKKTMIIALIALVLAVTALVAVFFLTRPEANQDTKTFTVKVVHADGTEKSFSFTTEAEYLGDFLVEKGVIEIGNADEGMFHYADGEAAIYEENGAYWGFYVNDGYATVGIFDTPIEDGAAYELRYEDASSWA